MRIKFYLWILLPVFALGLARDAAPEQAAGPQVKASKPKASKAKEELYMQLELFADAVSAIRSDYVDEVESRKIVYGALKGMLGSLDDYSLFLDPDEYKEIKVETKGEFGGIGIEINMKDGLLTVIAPISGSPADSAGVLSGDRIVKINGKITKKMTIDDAVKELRGSPGTTVSITVWREKEDKILDFSLKRKIIKIESIKRSAILEEKIGYIKLVEFQENTPKDFEAALAKLEKEGMDALILDLRNNPGGLLDISVAVSEKLLAVNNLIVSTKSRVQGQNIEFRSRAIFPRTNFPLVVMINEGSASASEIVAGAIQDNKRGVILGTKSFGKGSVQTVMPLRDGSALKLTTASYFTPSGRSIRGEGVIPDVVVERETPPEEAKSKRQYIFDKLESKPVEKPADATVAPAPSAAEKDKERDNQLDRAIDVIKGIKAYKKAQ